MGVSIVRIFNTQKLSLRNARVRIGGFSESIWKSFADLLFVVCDPNAIFRKKNFTIRRETKGGSMGSKSTFLFLPKCLNSDSILTYCYSLKTIKKRYRRVPFENVYIKSMASLIVEPPKFNGRKSSFFPSFVDKT